MRPRKFLFILMIFLIAGSIPTDWTVPVLHASEPHRFGGLTSEEIIGADQLREKQLKQEKFILFDARNKKSYDAGHIEGAVLPLGGEYYLQEELFRQKMIKEAPDKDKALAQGMSQYSKDTPIVTYCNSNCQASAVLAFKIKKLGFTDVKAMEDGFQAWEKKNYPTQRTVA